MPHPTQPSTPPADRPPVQAAWDFVRQHMRQAQGKSRSNYWLLWAGFTVMVILTAITGHAGNVFGGLVGAGLCGAYTYYLYNGGRIIFVPMWLMVVLLIAPVALILNIISPSGSSQPTSKLLDMTCTDYNKLGQNERYKIAKKLYAATYTEGTAAYEHALAVNNIEYHCMTSPYGKLRWNL